MNRDSPFALPPTTMPSNRAVEIVRSAQRGSTVTTVLPFISSRFATRMAEASAGVETGGCPHIAIREDASINLAAVRDMGEKFPDLDLVFVESGGDNLSATFSRELADITIYVIDVSAGDKILRKGGPGITRSDLLVINKIDLAPYVGADLGVPRDAGRPTAGVCTNPRRLRRSGAGC